MAANTQHGHLFRLKRPHDIVGFFQDRDRLEREPPVNPYRNLRVR